MKPDLSKVDYFDFNNLSEEMKKELKFFLPNTTKPEYYIIVIAAYYGLDITKIIWSPHPNYLANVFRDKQIDPMYEFEVAFNEFKDEQGKPKVITFKLPTDSFIDIFPEGIKKLPLGPHPAADWLIEVKPKKGITTYTGITHWPKVKVLGFPDQDNLYEHSFGGLVVLCKGKTFNISEIESYRVISTKITNQEYNNFIYGKQ